MTECKINITQILILLLPSDSHNDYTIVGFSWVLTVWIEMCLMIIGNICR